MAIVSVLLGFAHSAFSLAQQRAGALQGASILRQTGAATILYAAENNGRLPGPMWPGQIPIYDSSRPGRLVVDLAPYLTIQESATPFLVDSFVPQLLKNRLETLVAEPRVFVLRTQLADGQQPFGALPGADGSEPLPLAGLSNPGQTWMLSDADQQHPFVVGRPWQTSTIPSPVAPNSTRNVLFFDGRVESVGEEFDWEG